MAKIKKETQIKVRDENEVSNLIQQAIINKTPVEIMERLFVLHKEVKAEKAKEAYVRAMATFQEQCPVIEKTKKVLNKDGRTVRYQYAPIDAIAEQIKKPLSENGLSYKWDVENREGFIKAMAIITHQMGHSEGSSFEVPIDPEGFMTAPQKYASALTFAKRYSLCNALGISTGDEDTDATDVGKETDVKSKKAKIIFLLKALNEKYETKEQIEEAVKKVAKLSLIEKNYDEIISRLDLTLKEKTEYDKEQNANN